MIHAESQTVLTWSFTGPYVHDTTQFPFLVQAVGARIREIYADAGYLSRRNCEAAIQAGATPFIRPKITTRIAPPAPAGRPDTRHPFHRMVGAEQANREAWYSRYKRRNRVESTFAGIKRRLGGRLRAINHGMRLVEARLKLVVWNLLRVRQGEF